MPQRLVSPDPGQDDAPGREEDWLAWCESVENQLNSDDEEEPDEDAAPWDTDLDAIIAECREITAEGAALAARAADRDSPSRRRPIQEPGGCAPPEAGRICWSGSTRSTPSGAITGSRLGAMIRGSR
jgi:hypothetical protein